MNDVHQIAPWTLYKTLGEGGNAAVWEATREGDDQRRALKVISARKATREPYQRFVREIETLRSVGAFEGVLPLIDAYLPEAPSAEDRPWLAMPIARPLSEALAEASLEISVEAVAQIAITLANLAADHQLGHRDVKPGNLYELDGKWLVGDFGLVAVPDVGELTRPGRPLGPVHYAAYEMIVNPAQADPYPADVYSLGKTLWVLATGQSFPPEGHQRAGTRGFTVGDFRHHVHTAMLDRLIDSMTLIHPEDRPTMRQVARDLRAWQEMAAETPAVDLTQAAARLREKLASELAAGERRGTNKEQAMASVRRLQMLSAPLNDALQQLHPDTEVDVMDDKFTNNTLRTFVETGAREIQWSWKRCTRVPVGPEYRRYSLRMGRGLELAGDGTLILRAFIDVGYPSFGGNDFYWQSGDLEAPVGSLESDQKLQEAVADLTEQLEKAVEVFVDKAPTASDQAAGSFSSGRPHIRQ